MSGASLSLYLSHPHTHTHLHTLTHTLTHTLSIALERMDIAKIQWSPSVGGLFSGFGVSLFLFYSLTPWVIRMSSAVVFNLSLLTADFYSLIFGLFLFHYKVRVCLCTCLCVCVCVCVLLIGFCVCADVDSDNQIMSSTIPFSLYYPYLSYFLLILPPSLPHPPTLTSSHPPTLTSSHPPTLTSSPSSPPSPSPPPHPPHPHLLPQFSGFYIMGFCLVVLGIFIYNLKHPVEKKFKERTEEERRERSIERLFSVATTKVC